FSDTQRSNRPGSGQTNPKTGPRRTLTLQIALPDILQGLARSRGPLTGTDEPARREYKSHRSAPPAHASSASWRGCNHTHRRSSPVGAFTDLGVEKSMVTTAVGEGSGLGVSPTMARISARTRLGAPFDGHEPAAISEDSARLAQSCVEV